MSLGYIGFCNAKLGNKDKAKEILTKIDESTLYCKLIAKASIFMEELFTRLDEDIR